jgi:hypothetical protein
MRFYELQVRCEAPLPLDDISGGGYEVAVLIAKLAPQGSSGASAVVHADRNAAAHDGPWHTRVSRKRQLDDAGGCASDAVAVNGQSRFQLQQHVRDDQGARALEVPPLHFCFLEEGIFSVQIFSRPFSPGLGSSYQPVTHETPIIPATPTGWRLSCEVSTLISSTFY